MKRVVCFLALAGCSPFDAGAAKTNDVPLDAGASVDAAEAGASAGVTLRDATSGTALDQTSIDIPIPSGAEPDDVLVVFLDIGDAGNLTKLDGTPAGWSTRLSSAGFKQETFTYVFSRTAAGAEGMFTATASGTFSGLGWIFAFSGAKNDVVATQHTFEKPATSLQTDPFLIPPADGDAVLVGFAGFDYAREALDWGIPTGFTLVSRQTRETRSGLVAFSRATPVLGSGPFIGTVPQSPIIDFATATAIVVRRK